MGGKFGELYKIRGIVYYRLSPHEQSAFKGMVREGFPNLLRRIHGSIYRFAPIGIFTYLLYRWAEEENHRINRKNPKDFENDV